MIYITETMSIRSIAANDFISGEGTNSGRLLTLPVSPERRNDVCISSTQYWTQSAVHCLNISLIIHLIIISKIFKFNFTGSGEVSPSGKDNRIVDLIGIVSKRQTSRLNIFYIKFKLKIRINPKIIIN
jgi:hypothetical protein